MKLRLTLVLITAVLMAANKGDQVPQEQEKLKGKWQAVRIESDGTGAPSALVKLVKLYVTNHSITTTIVKTEIVNDQINVLGADETYEYHYIIDPSKNPKEIDLVPIEESGEGAVRKAIYSVTESTLTICGAEAGGDRPTGFATKPGSGLHLMKYKRTRD